MPTRPADRSGRPRLRVLTLVDGIGTHGGGESLARLVTQRLDPDQFEATYCVTRWEPRAEYQGAIDELEAAGVEFLGIQRAGRIDPRSFRPVIQRLRDGRVDILHSHKFGSNVWAAVFARLARPPVFVAHEHTWSYSGDRTRALLDRRLIASTADAFIAVSRDDQRKMVEIERIPREKTRFIPNGIELEPVANGARAEVRAELGIDMAQPVIGTVAALRPQKALHLLIEASVSLRRQYPELVVLIVGGEDSRGGEEGDRLRALVSREGAGEFIRFLGIRADVPRVLSALDVAVLSSDYEGSPLSVLEFMDVGLPVVATSVGGVPDIVVDGETGILVQPGDAQALASGIRKLLGDPALAKRMGEAGRERRRSEFTLAATVAQVEALYRELYDGGVRG